MKRALAILLFTAYSFHAIELEQVFKLPFLAQHFAEHQKEDPRITLAVFIWQHYVTSDHHPSHTQKHQKLPFKTCDNIQVSVNLPAQPQDWVVPAERPCVGCCLKEYLPHAGWLIPSFNSSIWKPPRAC